MATNVVMPKMGESITEGTVLRWLKKPGDQVKKDEPILEISTDKVDTEVPSPVAGTLLQQVAQEKETVAVGGLIAVIGEAGEVLNDNSPKKPEVSDQEKTEKKAKPKAEQPESVKPKEEEKATAKPVSSDSSEQ